MKQSERKLISEFLDESNKIEQVYDEQSLVDAMEAWDYAYENKAKLTLNDVLEIHYLLLQNLDPEIAGRWGDCDIYIGGRVRKFFHESQFKEGVQEVLNEMYDEVPLTWGKEMKEVEAKRLHVKFEKLHPFNDGNGRTGRILWQIHRLHLGLPIQIIFDQKKQEYYKWFR